MQDDRSNIGYVSELGSNAKVAWVGFEKNWIYAVQTVIKNLHMGLKQAKSPIWATFICSVNIGLEPSRKKRSP